MKSRRTWWTLYILCALGAGAVLFWISTQALALERAERIALAEADHEEAVRLALWRMDSWFSPLAAAEASRPIEHYRPSADDPAPLAAFTSPWIHLHFEYRADFLLSCPQLPPVDSGAMPELLNNAIDSAPDGDKTSALVTRRALLDQLAAALDTPQRLAAAITAAEAHNEALADNAWLEPILADNTARNALQIDGSELQANWGNREAGRRAASSQIAQQQSITSNYVPPDDLIDEAPVVDPPLIGPLHPVWLESADLESDEPILILVRRAARHDDPTCQGALIDWPAVRTALLQQIDDLFPDADLTPLMTADLDERNRLAARSLASLPAMLEAPPPVVPAVTGLSTPTRIMLAVCWPLLAVTLLVVGLTLRASIAFGERRARFASAVTHELRTPLTTFRMYSDMLASGMVADEQRKREYLDTLKRESDRLATLVENVLAYSRIERGVARIERHALDLDILLERVRPMLDQRCAMSDMILAIDNRAVPGCAVLADQDAVGQILLNLVDNACKYGRADDARAITITAVPTGHALNLIVQDAGPGVAPEDAAAIFRPFQRGAAVDEGPAPGIGLGLALARELARRLDGDLILDATASTPGARFVLTLRTERHAR
jgi:signal transduction histidine kinase